MSKTIRDLEVDVQLASLRFDLAQAFTRIEWLTPQGDFETPGSVSTRRARAEAHQRRADQEYRDARIALDRAVREANLAPGQAAWEAYCRAQR